ncbi:hypothetical protein [Nostoc sp.]|uniref:hypothetical protein n=1 Tax=Nostoc sp. TaxID=1180 RepID=UPI002FF85C47
MRSCKAVFAGKSHSALLRSPLALAKRSLLNPTNDSWQGNNQNPIDQASQNAGAEHLVKYLVITKQILP